MVVNCPVSYTSSASNGAVSKNSAPVIAVEDDSTAVAVTAKDGGALFRLTNTNGGIRIRVLSASNTAAIDVSTKDGG